MRKARQPRVVQRCHFHFLIQGNHDGDSGVASTEAARGHAAFCGEAGSEGEGKSLGSHRTARMAWHMGGQAAQDCRRPGHQDRILRAPASVTSRGRTLCAGPGCPAQLQNHAGLTTPSGQDRGHRVLAVGYGMASSSTRARACRVTAPQPFVCCALMQCWRWGCGRACPRASRTCAARTAAESPPGSGPRRLPRR